VSGIDDIHLNGEVLAQEVRRISVVGEDSADFGGRQEDVLWLFI
jgi:hypothetical protein